MTDGRLATVVDRLAALHPSPRAPSGEVDRALRLLCPGLSPERAVAAADVAAVGVGVTGALLGLVPGAGEAAFPAGVAIGCAVRLGLLKLPPLALALRRTRAVGDAADLVCRLVMRLRVAPTVEAATRFAARTGEGPLAASLGRHARRARGTPRSGLGRFADEWSEWCPALPRASGLLHAGAGARAEDGDRTVSRALTTTLEDLRERTAAFAADVRGPATGLYAAGVLLPLALVGVLPAARAAGVRVPLAAFAAVYDLAIPVGVAAGGLSLLARRPAAFPPPPVDRTHPDVPDRHAVEFGGGAVAGLVAVGLAALVVAPWAAPVAGIGVGVGAAFALRYGPVKEVRDEVRDVESGLPDALSLVGRRVAAGEAVESALGRAAEEVTGPAGEVLADADHTLRTLRVDVGAAFLGEYGALRTVPSPRARSVAALFALAAREGRPAGDVLVAAADHLSELRRVERESRRELATVTNTLANTAALFGPLVGGVTVALAGRLARAEGEALAAGYGVDALGLVVGAYVLALAAVLAGLAAALEAGLDPAVVGYRIGVALPVATVTYLTSVVGAGLLV